MPIKHFANFITMPGGNGGKLVYCMIESPGAPMTFLEAAREIEARLVFARNGHENYNFEILDTDDLDSAQGEVIVIMGVSIDDLPL